MKTIPTLETLQPGQSIYLGKRKFIINSWRNDGKIYLAEGENEFTIYSDELKDFTEKPSE
jgi:hypothetical protein